MVKEEKYTQLQLLLLYCWLTDQFLAYGVSFLKCIRPFGFEDSRLYRERDVLTMILQISFTQVVYSEKLKEQWMSACMQAAHIKSQYIRTRIHNQQRKLSEYIIYLFSLCTCSFFLLFSPPSLSLSRLSSLFFWWFVFIMIVITIIIYFFIIIYYRRVRINNDQWGFVCSL